MGVGVGVGMYVSKLWSDKDKKRRLVPEIHFGSKILPAPPFDGAASFVLKYAPFVPARESQARNLCFKCSTCHLSLASAMMMLSGQSRFQDASRKSQQEVEEAASCPSMIKQLYK